MSTDHWEERRNGLLLPPQPPPRNPSPDQFMEEIRSEFDGALSELRESIDSSRQSAAGLGLTSYYWEQASGEMGFNSGAVEEVLRLLAERLTVLHGTLYGGQYGFGYGSGGQEVGDTIRQLSQLIWIFPEYNPLIKQMVEIRGLYVFGQGVEIRGESKRKKKAAIEKLKKKREEIQAQQELQAAMQPTPLDGPSPTANGTDNGNSPGASMMRNSEYQRYGGTGRAPSTPGGRSESLSETLSPSGHDLSGARLIGSGDESDIARVVSEFWEDPCNLSRFCSVEAQQRVDKQKMIEGNVFVILRNMGANVTPSVTIFPTYAIQGIIVDDLQDGTGQALGYIVSPPRKWAGADAANQANRMIYPDMVSDDLVRLRKVLEAHGADGFVIDESVRCYHMKEWGPTWRSYGLPGILSSIQSATKYVSYVSEWVIMQRVWRTYAMMITGYGQNKGLNQIQANYANRVANLFQGAGGSPDVLSPTGVPRTPPMGMAAMSGMSPTGLSGTRIEPVRTSGSTDPPAMGREMRLLSEMGVGLPDNMFSDTNVGTMTRADVLERSTHLKFLTEQRIYTEMYKVISTTVVKFRLGDEKVKDVDISVNWPAIITPSNVEQAGSLIQMYQGDLIPKKVAVEEALKILKRADLHEIMQILFPTDEDGMELKSDSDLDMLSMAGQGQPGQPMEPADPNNPLSSVESLMDFSIFGVDERLYG